MPNLIQSISLERTLSKRELVFLKLVDSPTYQFVMEAIGLDPDGWESIERESNSLKLDFVFTDLKDPFTNEYAGEETPFGRIAAITVIDYTVGNGSPEDGYFFGFRGRSHLTLRTLRWALVHEAVSLVNKQAVTFTPNIVSEMRGYR